MKIIGLCGRSGSGKSTAAAVFKEMGCDVISADEVSRSVMSAGSDCLAELAVCFGKDILRDDGTLDRHLLANRAFSEREKAALLNSVTHKYILRRIDELIAVSEAENIIIDAPLLFEAGLQDKCFAIIGIIAPDGECISRAAKRDGITEADVEKRLKNQHGNDYLLTYCTHIINNSGSLDEFRENVKQTLKTIIGD